MLIGTVVAEPPSMRAVISLIEGLAAGNYELTVSAYVPEWRQRPRTSKQLVTVTDGAATDVILTIDLTPPRSVNVPLMNTERQ